MPPKLYGNLSGQPFMTELTNCSICMVGEWVEAATLDSYRTAVPLLLLCVTNIPTHNSNQQYARANKYYTARRKNKGDEKTNQNVSHDSTWFNKPYPSYYCCCGYGDYHHHHRHRILPTTTTTWYSLDQLRYVIGTAQCKFNPNFRWFQICSAEGKRKNYETPWFILLFREFQDRDRPPKGYQPMHRPIITQA